MLWLEQGAMRADGIEVAAADMAEWDEAAVAFRETLNSARKRAAPLPESEEEAPSPVTRAGSPAGGRDARSVVGGFVSLFRARYR
jgi:hypothetical protein